MKQIKRKKRTVEKKSKNYVDNSEFLKDLIDYKKEVKRNKGIRVKISDKLAQYFIDIATNLANKGKFTSYTFKDEMVADAIENCITYMNNFDPKKSSNPFTYFTTIIYWAFVRRIKKEKKNLYVKYKSFLSSELSDDEEILTMMQNHDTLIDYKREFVEKFESSMQKKKDSKKMKVKKKLKMVNCFLED